MAALSAELHGVKQLFRGSEKLFDQIGEQAERALAGVAEAKAREARVSVPRKSGKLAGSILARGPHVDYGGGVPYAGWIEFGGTRGRPYVPAGRYAYPVITDVEPQLESVGTKTAKDEIRGFRWPSPRM